MDHRMDHLREPEPTTSETSVLFERYLDWYRETMIAKVAALPDDERRRTRLPSGWTPLEVLNHVAYVERRWFVWGFLAEHVEAPWGDQRDDRWHVDDGTTLDDVAAFLRRTGSRTRQILRDTPLETPAAVGGRFTEDPPSLAWICFHVLQEYARHAGHLDVAVELAGGPTGE